MTLTSFALRRGALLSTVLIIGSALAACGGGSASPGGGATVGVLNGTVELTSDELEFNASTIRAPAGEEFTVTLINAESQPHNFALYTADGGQVIVQGEIITGPNAEVDTVVPALQPGTYFFKCDLHPEMNGTVVVEA